MKKMIKIFRTIVSMIMLLVGVSGFSQLVSTNKIDVVTGAVITVDYEHHEVHGGSHYTFTDYDADLDATDTMGYVLTTVDTRKWTHFVFMVDAQLETRVEFYETTTRGEGAAQTSFNNNRNSSNTAGTTINLMDDGGANGTLIFKDHFGISTGLGSNRIVGGGGSRGEQEWILKQDTKYLLLIISYTADNIVATKFSWYEHE